MASYVEHSKRVSQFIPPQCGFSLSRSCSGKSVPSPSLDMAAGILLSAQCATTKSERAQILC